MKSKISIAVLFCLIVFVVGGCASQKAVPKKAVVYPSISELEPLSFSTVSADSWADRPVCWLGQADDVDSDWQIKWTPQRVNRRVKKECTTLIERKIREQLVGSGFEVKEFGDQAYLRREERLCIEKQILLKGYSVKQVKVKEGYCYDMQLVFDVIDYPETDKVRECVVPGRCFVEQGAEKEWGEIFQDCVDHLVLSADFQEACRL